MYNKTNIIKYVVLTVICIVLLIAVILFFTTDFFRTKRSVFLRYFNSTLNALHSVDTETYKEYQEAKKTKSYIRKANMTIQSSNNIADSNILDKIKFTMTTKNNNKSELLNSNISIKYQNEELANIQVVKEKNVFGVYCPLVSNGFVSVRNENLKEVAEKIGIEDVSLIPDTINNFSGEELLMISKNEKNHLDNIIKNVIQRAPDTAFTKEGSKKINIDGEEFNANVYALELNSKENADLQIDLLEKISQDSIMMNFITSKFKLLNIDENYNDINLLSNIIKKRIKKLKQPEEDIGNMKVTVYENKLKNIRTEIKIGDNVLRIDHVENSEYEKSIFKLNDTSIQFKREQNNYYIKYENKGELTRSIEITYNQEGTLAENNIKNKMIITKKDGIKSITYNYSDEMNFTDDVGAINGFSGNSIVILNDYDLETVRNLVNTIIEKTNSAYVNKGASIGINLDPLIER